MIQKHVHKLKRHKYKTGNEVFFCTLPDCHFKIEAALALGKKSLCNLCNAEFILNEYTVKLARPHCDACSKQKIKGPDGKNHFIRKNSLPIIASIASENTDSLRSRLQEVAGMLEDDDL